MTDLATYSPSAIDRLFLVGRNIEHSYRISKNIVAFICKTTLFTKNDKHVIVKFSYSGNVQYHRISLCDMDKFEYIFDTAKNSGVE
ncbi:hypothetical protein PsAD37_03552 [Pseudovibrio sp. Ad37]|nr:hypothetical protein PsAD37_03552 [Pseudovibrio sp. Ad37]